MLFMLVGCTPQTKREQPLTAPVTIDWRNPSETTNSVIIENDEFTREKKYFGPNIVIHEELGQAQFGTVDLLIRAWKTKQSTTPELQIYVHSLSGDWQHFYGAYDSNGEKLDFLLISKEVGECLGGTGVCTHEHIGINVTQEYLRKHIATGLRFKVIGKNGDEIYTINGPYIQGFLFAVNK